MTQDGQNAGHTEGWLSPYMNSEGEPLEFSPDRFLKTLTDSGYKQNPIRNLITDLHRVTGLDPRDLVHMVNKYRAHGHAARREGGGDRLPYLRSSELVGLFRRDDRGIAHEICYPNPESYVIWRTVNARRVHSGHAPVRFDQLFGYMPTDQEAVVGRRSNMVVSKPEQAARLYAYSVASRRMFESFLRLLDRKGYRDWIQPRQYIPSFFQRPAEFYVLFNSPWKAYSFSKNESTGKLKAEPSDGLRALSAHLACKAADILPPKEAFLLTRMDHRLAPNIQIERVTAYLTEIGMQLPASYRVDDSPMTLGDDASDAGIDFAAAALQIVRVCRRDNVTSGMMDNIAPFLSAMNDAQREIIARAKTAAGFPPEAPDAVVLDVWNSYSADKINKLIIDGVLDKRPIGETAQALSLTHRTLMIRQRNGMRSLVSALCHALPPFAL